MTTEPQAQPLEAPETALKIARFLESATIMSNGCWEWNGPRYPDGYGRASAIRNDHFAHRHSYRLHVGPIPKGKVVRHRCNNPPCVNPDHLKLGTQADNFFDAVAAGTAPIGTKNGQAKHSTETVHEIRRLYALGVSQRAIGRAVNVPTSTISDIVHRRRRNYE